jgi:23S rRNA (pseudouridine1915-N3)-methyltransferase
MKIAIAAIGRMKTGPERELVARYLERATASGKPLALTGFDVSEINESRAGSAAARKAEEARALRAALPEGITVMLDERGKGLNSEAFASQLARWRDDGRPAVGFVIGGADGIDPDFVRAADLTVSFSPMVWPHQLVRIMLAEQLYRATTILSGHPYHRGD